MRSLVTHVFGSSTNLQYSTSVPAGIVACMVSSSTGSTGAAASSLHAAPAVAINTIHAAIFIEGRPIQAVDQRNPAITRHARAVHRHVSFMRVKNVTN